MLPIGVRATETMTIGSAMVGSCAVRAAIQAAGWGAGVSGDNDGIDGHFGNPFQTTQASKLPSLSRNAAANSSRSFCSATWLDRRAFHPLILVHVTRLISVNVPVIIFSENAKTTVREGRGCSTQSNGRAKRKARMTLRISTF
jgi:hypothetical protein